MKKPQADAMVEAILEPYVHAQDERRQRKAVMAASIARRRRVAWCGLLGVMAGIAIGYVNDLQFVGCALWEGAGGRCNWPDAKFASCKSVTGQWMLFSQPLSCQFGCPIYPAGSVKSLSRT